MITTIHLADAIGRRKIAEALGVLPTAVSNAVVRGRFPSSWFLILSRLAADAGLDCPPELFGMRFAQSGGGAVSDGVAQGGRSDPAPLAGAS